MQTYARACIVNQYYDVDARRCHEKRLLHERELAFLESIYTFAHAYILAVYVRVADTRVRVYIRLRIGASESICALNHMYRYMRYIIRNRGACVKVYILSLA